MEITREQKALAAQVTLPNTPLPSTPGRCPAWLKTLRRECRYPAADGLLCRIHHLVAERKLQKLRERQTFTTSNLDDIRPDDHIVWKATWMDGSVKRTDIREGVAHHRDHHGDWWTEDNVWLTEGDGDDITITIRRTTTAALPHLTTDDLRNTPGGRELMAQTLRAAGRAAVSVEDGVPWDHDHDRATVAAWLDDLAESIHPGNPDAAKEGDQ